MLERNTLQRQLVYTAVMSLGCHPTADEVYASVIREHPSVSRGTVYRNLNRLAESGLLRKIRVGDSADRYDGTLSGHYHIFCNRCGSFLDIDYPYLKRLNEEIEQSTGFLLDEHDIVFTGLCPACKPVSEADNGHENP